MATGPGSQDVGIDRLEDIDFEVRRALALLELLQMHSLSIASRARDTTVRGSEEAKESRVSLSLLKLHFSYHPSLVRIPAKPAT